MVQAFPLNIQSKRLTWRLMESAHENVGNSEEYNNSRRKVLKRDDYTCRAKDCGFRSPPDATGMTYMEVHHLNDDHKNHNPENLATICPICHQLFHMGVAGMRNSAVMIWMPEISQGTLNQICRSIFVAIQTDSEMSGSAKAMYASLEARAIYLEEMMSPGASDPLFFGQALLDIDTQEVSNALLSNIRMLPTYERFKDAIEHWVKNGYQGLLPDTWDALVKTSADPTLSSLRTYMPDSDDGADDTIFDGSIASRNHGLGLASAFAAMEKLEQGINEEIIDQLSPLSDGNSQSLKENDFSDLDSLSSLYDASPTSNVVDSLAETTITTEVLASLPRSAPASDDSPPEFPVTFAELASLERLDVTDTAVELAEPAEAITEKNESVAELAEVSEAAAELPTETEPVKSAKKKQSSFQNQGTMFDPEEAETVAEEVPEAAPVEDISYGNLSEQSFQDQNLIEAQKQETFAGYLAVAGGLPPQAPEKSIPPSTEASDGGMMNLSDQIALMDDLIYDEPDSNGKDTEVAESLASQFTETQSDSETKDQ